MTDRNQKLFDAWCPPGSEPIEHWIERLLSTAELSVTARMIGMVLAHRYATGTPNPIPFGGDEWRAIIRQVGPRLTSEARELRSRVERSLETLRECGLVKIHGHDAIRDGESRLMIDAIELLITKGGAQ